MIPACSIGVTADSRPTDRRGCKPLPQRRGGRFAGNGIGILSVLRQLSTTSMS
jgi:hypothetical protein